MDREIDRPRESPNLVKEKFNVLSFVDNVAKYSHSRIPKIHAVYINSNRRINIARIHDYAMYARGGLQIVSVSHLL